MPNIIHTANGILQGDPNAEGVRRTIREAVDAAPPGGLVFYFHGGLNSERQGRAIAEKLDPPFRAVRAIPFFVVWESGLFETFVNNFKEILGKYWFKILWIAVRWIVKRKQRGALAFAAEGPLPPVDRREVEAEFLALSGGVAPPQGLIAEPDPAGELTPAEEAQLEQELSTDADLQAAVTEATGPQMGFAPSNAAAGAVQIAVRVVRRLVSGRGHGIHMTIAEEIYRQYVIGPTGEFVWGLMKKDTLDNFGSDPTTFGGSAILSALDLAVGDRIPPRVTLVGHSTGALFIAHFLATANERLRGKWTFDVVFLGAAISTADFADRILPHRSWVRRYRSFGLGDSFEAHDPVIRVSLLYPGSLLYAVSGMFETEADMPLVGMERYWDLARYPAARFPAIEQVRRFTAEANAAVWSYAGPDQPPGRQCTAKSHGDFDEVTPGQLTIGSVNHLLETEWAPRSG